MLFPHLDDLTKHSTKHARNRHRCVNPACLRFYVGYSKKVQLEKHTTTHRVVEGEEMDQVVEPGFFTSAFNEHDYPEPNRQQLF